MTPELTPDQALLQWINGDWASPALDLAFAWITDKYRFSLPLLLLLLAWAVREQRWAGLRWWLGLTLVVMLADGFGNVLKDLFAEARPCAFAQDWVRLIGGQTCGEALRGMPSNHALLGFAMWAYMVGTRRDWRRWQWVFFVTAVLVALSRIYLAKHLPSQVLMGVWAGIVFGFACALVWRGVARWGIGEDVVR